MPENRLIKILIAIAILIACINIIDRVFNEPSWQIHRLFDMDAENNFTVWFTSLLWIIAAYLAYRIYQIQKAKIWLVVSMSFLFFSCDETASMHEYFSLFVDRHFFKMNLNSYWTIVFAPLIIPIGVIIILLLRKHLLGSKKAIKFLSFGVGLFILGSMILEQGCNLEFYESSNLFKWIEIILEETFEMLGAILIIKGLIEHRNFLLAIKTES